MIDYFIKKYLQNKPLFYSLIRPQEACLFNKCSSYIKSPVLDFGCGDGFFAEILFGKGKIDVGIDLEDKKTDGYKKVVVYDGTRLPFKKDNFSTVISNCVLEHIPDLDQSIREIHRVLKPGGYFLTTVMTDQWDNHMFGPYIKFMAKIQRHHQLLSLTEWNRNFERNGFRIINTVGYLSLKNACYLDLIHYPSVIPFVNRLAIPFIPLIRKVIQNPVKKELSGALFYCLRKTITVG